MPLLLALDQGTSSSRALLFDAAGRQVAAAQRGFDQLFPHDGWVELEPETLWTTTLAAGREAIAKSGVRPADIAAIGITNQRETTLVWDARSGKAVGNAIVWQDRRTAAHCQQMIEEGMEAELVDATGLLVDPYFSSTKLAWLLQDSELRARAEVGALKFGTVDSFLIWRLTKGARHATDATNASRTQLFDIGRQAWSGHLLDYFNVPAAMLPHVLDCADDFGTADAEWFGAPIPIRGVAGRSAGRIDWPSLLRARPNQEHPMAAAASLSPTPQPARVLAFKIANHRCLSLPRRTHLRSGRQHL